MALSPQIESLLRAEDQLIGQSASRIEDALAAFMDQAVSSFERNGQFVVPSGTAHAELLDSLAINWQSAVGLGVDHFYGLSQKQEGLTLRAALEYLETYGLSRTRQIVGTTTKQLTQLIIAGQRQGLTSSQIMRQLINRIPQIAATRAKIIAETEIHSAVQFGAYNAAMRSGRLLVKVWNTVEDDRVRDFHQGAHYSHRLAEGQKKALDNSFQIPHISGGTEALRFPGDPEGSAGNIINCRCVATFEEP